MTLKNILSILSFLFIAVACSMEDDNLPSSDTKASVEAQEVLVNVNLAMNGISTKVAASDDGNVAPAGNESVVSSAVVALVNAEGYIMMIRNAKGQIDSDNTLKDVKFLTKVADGVKAIAIVNTEKANDYLNCKTLEDLNSVLETTANQEYLVKVGEKNDIFKGYNGGKTSTKDLNTLNIEIPVTQLAARIDLMGIKYKKDNESSEVNSVKIISAQLMNVNNNSHVYNIKDKTMSGLEATNIPSVATLKKMDISLTEGVWAGNNPDIEEVGKSLYTDYSYTNTTDSPVKMQITYSVNNEEAKTVDVTIDNGSVKAGNLYRLYIGMKVKNNEIKTEVVCYTKDWIKENINIEI